MTWCKQEDFSLSSQRLLFFFPAGCTSCLDGSCQAWWAVICFWWQVSQQGCSAVNCSEIRFNPTRPREAAPSGHLWWLWIKARQSSSTGADPRPPAGLPANLKAVDQEMEQSQDNKGTFLLLEDFSCSRGNGKEVNNPWLNLFLVAFHE